jgi:hypothetical protein
MPTDPTLHLLDANDPNQVDSPRIIEVDLPDPNQKMLILSGIARPEWSITDDANVYFETVTVNLRRSVLAVVQATVAVGLASIGNKDTAFQFACNSTDLQPDPKSQELMLTVQLALRGDYSTLNRFGYQVVTIVTIQTTGISGTIRWAKNIFDGSSLTPAQLAQIFLIAANTTQTIIPPQGFQYIQYTPVAYGVATGITNDGNDYIVAYNIPGGPYNTPLVPTVAVGTLFGATGPVLCGQVSGPNPVILTVTHPGATNVNFRVSVPQIS